MAVYNDYIQYGGDLMLFINSQPVAFSTSAKLSVSNKTREISTKDSGNWTEKKAGRYDWNASTDALYNMSTTGTTMDIMDLYAIFTGGSAVTLSFACKTGTTPNWTVSSTVKYFTGSAIITSFDFNASDGDSATYSISLEGTGALLMSA